MRPLPYDINVATVQKVARDHLEKLSPVLKLPTDFLRNRKGPCPGCGGQDRFGFNNREGRSTLVYSQVGYEPLAGDGLLLLPDGKEILPPRVAGWIIRYGGIGHA